MGVGQWLLVSSEAEIGGYPQAHMHTRSPKVIHYFTYYTVKGRSRAASWQISVLRLV